MASDLRAPNVVPASASSGSQTILQTNGDIRNAPTATLRLRATRASDARHIQWAEDVVDNEGMGKKSSKVCCIYHKPHEPGDSDSEDSSSSSSESDDEPDLSRAQRAGDNNKRKSRKQDHTDAGKGKQRRPSPNAYERQPKQKSAPTG